MQEALRPNHQRAKVAITLIWIILVLQAMMHLADFWELTMLVRYQNGGQNSQEMLQWSDNLQLVLAPINTVVYIISGVTFIQWFRRAYYNLALRVQPLNTTDGWASGGWFVPIMSLFKPFQIMRELFVETKGYLAKNIPGFQAAEHANLIGWWWALWVISSLASNLQTRLILMDNSVEMLIASDYMSVGLALANVPLAILAVKVVQAYSGLEAIMANLPQETQAGNAATRESATTPPSWQ